jgi:hypothetical protein
MGMDESPRLEDVLKQYVALADNRDAVLRKEAEEEAAERKKEQEERKRMYEREVKELSLELEKTVNGEYAPVLTKILKGKNDVYLLGEFDVERHDSAPLTFTYGICLKFENDTTNELKIHFYAKPMQTGCKTQDRMTPEDFLARVKMDNGTGPKLALTAWYYKKALTHAVLKEIENLRKAAGVQ